MFLNRIIDLSHGPFAFIGMPGSSELMILLVIVLVLFGGAKLPSLMRNLGKSANEFKKGMSETSEEETPESDSTTEKV